MLTPDILSPSAQSLAQIIINCLIPGILLTLVVWILLKFLKLNATTNYILWFITLTGVAFTPFSGTLVKLSQTLEQPSLNRTNNPEALSIEEVLPLTTPSEALATPLNQNNQIANFEEGSSEQLSDGEYNSAPSLFEQVQNLEIPVLPLSLIWFVAASYLTGFILLFTRLFRSYFSLARLKRHSETIQVSSDLPVNRRKLELKRCKDIAVPMAAGLTKPSILLPSQLEKQLSKTELEHVILHEYAHLIRFDDWSKLIQRIIQTLFFFHPAVHFISRRLDLEREVASDDWVISQQNQKRQQYASSLVKLVELALHRKKMKHPLVEGSAVMVKTQIEKRIGMLMDGKRRISNRLSRSWLFSFLGIVLLMGVGVVQFSPTLVVAIASSLTDVISPANAGELELIHVFESVEMPEVVFSPDGTLLLGAGADGKVWVWDVSTRELLPDKTFEVSKVKLWDVAYNPSGTLIATGDGLGDIRLWDASTFEPIGEAIPYEGFKTGAQRLAFNPEGDHLAVGFENGEVRLWDVESQTQIAGHHKSLIAYTCELAYSPDGTMIVTGGSDQAIVLHDATTLEPIGEPVGSRETGIVDPTCGVAFSPDGSMIVGGSEDSINVWDVETRQVIGDPLVGHRSRRFSPVIMELIYNPGGNIIASGSNDETVRLWDANTREPLGEPLRTDADGTTREGVYDVAFNPGGSLIAVASWGGDVLLWGLPEKKPQ